MGVERDVMEGGPRLLKVKLDLFSQETKGAAELDNNKLNCEKTKAMAVEKREAKPEEYGTREDFAKN